MLTMNKFSIEKHRIISSFNEAAITYDTAAFLQREVGDRLLERLDFMSINPAVILDLGAGTGCFTEKLKQKFYDVKYHKMGFFSSKKIC